jgi:uncharacterized membrane protein
MDFLQSKKAAGNIMYIVFEVVIVLALIPVIVTFIAGAENLTATETTLLSLVTLFLVLGLIYTVAKQTGLVRGN